MARSFENRDGRSKQSTRYAASARIFQAPSQVAGNAESK